MSTVVQASQFLGSVSHEQGIAWNFDRAKAMARIQELVNHPERLHQGHLNVCGPAVFFRTWFTRDPLGAAVFAYWMLKSGAADLGPVSIVPRPSLRACNYMAIRNEEIAAHGSTAMPHEADWMLLSSLRDSENALVPYDGEPHSWVDGVGGTTLPMTLKSWLDATNVFSSVDNRTTLTHNDLNSLLSLTPTPEKEVILLSDPGIIGEIYANTAASPPAVDLVNLPMHYVVLREPVNLNANGTWLWTRLWSWGRYYEGWFGVQRFVYKYFGAVVATSPA